MLSIIAGFFLEDTKSGPGDRVIIFTKNVLVLLCFCSTILLLHCNSSLPRCSNRHTDQPSGTVQAAGQDKWIVDTLCILQGFFCLPISGVFGSDPVFFVFALIFLRLISL